MTRYNFSLTTYISNKLEEEKKEELKLEKRKSSTGPSKKDDRPAFLVVSGGT